MFAHLAKSLLISYCEQYILFLFRHVRDKDTIIKDLVRWKSILNLPIAEGQPIQLLAKLFKGWPEFRNLFYFLLDYSFISTKR